MENDRICTRRSILQASAVAGVGILTGCSGSIVSNPLDGTNTPEATESSTVDVDSTETPAKFSTRGSDSDRIGKDPENLMIMKSGLSGNSIRSGSNSVGGTDHSGWETAFESTSVGYKGLIKNQIEVYDEVSQAKRRYNLLSYQGDCWSIPR